MTDILGYISLFIFYFNFPTCRVFLIRVIDRHFISLSRRILYKNEKSVTTVIFHDNLITVESGMKNFEILGKSDLLRRIIPLKKKSNVCKSSFWI